MKKIIYIILIISIFLVGCKNNEVKEKANETSNKIKSEESKKTSSENVVKNKVNIDIENTVSKLCSDEIGVRSVGEKGNENATKYVESLIKDIGLDYVFDNTYLNEFVFKDIEIGGKEKNTNINNIVGKIKGDNSKNAIVVTAHFDAYQKNVLDNASGVGTVLKIANTMKNDLGDKKLKQDLIFCMTNAELNGFRGSENFINDIKDKYDKIYNVNVDCIGLKTYGPLALKNISKIDESEKLYLSIKNVLSESDIEFVEEISSEKIKKLLKNGLGASDYIAFEHAGYPNIHIAQSKLESLNDRTNDGVETLDYDYLNKLAKTMSTWLEDFEIK